MAQTDSKGGAPPVGNPGMGLSQANFGPKYEAHVSQLQVLGGIEHTQLQGRGLLSLGEGGMLPFCGTCCLRPCCYACV